MPCLADQPPSHDFRHGNDSGERRTTLVLALTVVVMAVEIVAGHLTGSMALLADGWHMGTHAAAFAITVFTYRFARRHMRRTSRRPARRADRQLADERSARRMKDGPQAGRLYLKPPLPGCDRFQR